MQYWKASWKMATDCTKKELEIFLFVSLLRRSRKYSCLITIGSSFDYQIVCCRGDKVDSA